VIRRRLGDSVNDLLDSSGKFSTLLYLSYAVQ
jgi:hypothetical protein